MWQWWWHIQDDLGKEMDALQFIVVHYAGEVRYTAYNWLDKNRGNLNPELALALCLSSSALLSALFDADSAPQPATTPRGGRGGGAKKATVGSSFRASLQAPAVPSTMSVDMRTGVT